MVKPSRGFIALDRNPDIEPATWPFRRVGDCATPRWVRIAGSHCSVSESGQVRNDRTGSILKGNADRYGYLRVRVGVRLAKVHRLVCETFHGPAPSATHEACHIDGDKLNNAPSNLRWGTKSENALDGMRHGTVKIPANRMPGESHPQAKLTAAQVGAIRQRCAEGAEQKAIAAEFGVHPSAVSRIKRGKAWATREPSRVSPSRPVGRVSTIAGEIA